MAEDKSVWPYSPSLALAILATILYGLIFLHLYFLTIIKYRAWYFVCVVIGAAVEVIGYAMRSYSAKQQEILPPFVVTSIFVVLAPVLIAAGNYLLIGRLIRAVLPPSRHRVFGMPARFLTRFFVTCDIISCIVQSGGSSVAASNNWKGPNERIGTYILIAGLSFQVFTFSLYMCIFVRFHHLGKYLEVETAPRGWINVVKAVYISSILIMIRSIYRVAEFAEGIGGYAFNHEWLFWIFETVPMLFAIGIFCWWHPSRYLGRDGGKRNPSKEGNATELSNDSRRRHATLAV